MQRNKKQKKLTFYSYRRLYVKILRKINDYIVNIQPSTLDAHHTKI